MKKTFLLTLVALLGIIVLAACGGKEEADAPPAGGDVENVTVTMNDIYFGDTQGDAASWEVSSGSSMNITADNKGALEHNWAIVKAGTELPDSVTDAAAVEDSILFDIGNIAGGDSGSGRFTAPGPGEYQVICTVAGHYPSMQGTLTVK